MAIIPWCSIKNGTVIFVIGKVLSSLLTDDGGGCGVDSAVFFHPVNKVQLILSLNETCPCKITFTHKLIPVMTVFGHPHTKRTSVLSSLVHTNQCQIVFTTKAIKRSTSAMWLRVQRESATRGKWKIVSVKWKGEANKESSWGANQPLNLLFHPISRRGDSQLYGDVIFKRGNCGTWFPISYSHSQNSGRCWDV